MPNNSSQIKRWMSYGFIGTIWLSFLIITLVFAILLAIYLDLRTPQTSNWTKGTGLENVARGLYLHYFRPGWQDTNGYVDYDPELIYVPRRGRFPFRSPEFNVTLTFDSDGLRHQKTLSSQHSQHLVAIAGDSFAMGWGVEDEQTFSALLASRYGIPTANAAVSSYATVRELLRLRRLGLLEKADTIIIAYAGNDDEENHLFSTKPSDIFAGGDARSRWSTLARYHQQQLSFALMAKVAWQDLSNEIFPNGARFTIHALLTDSFVSTGQARATTYPAKTMALDFLRVLDGFPELHSKHILVLDFDDWGRQTGFGAALRQVASDRPNLHVVAVPWHRDDFFRFDNHMTPRGHEEVAKALAATLKGLSSWVPLQDLRAEH